MQVCYNIMHTESNDYYPYCECNLYKHTLALHFSSNRLELAILHFNENANRQQAITKDGDNRYDIVFPKYKKGGYVVRKVTTDPTFSKCYVYCCIALSDYDCYYNNVQLVLLLCTSTHTGYVQDLVSKTVELCKTGCSLTTPAPEVPLPLSSQYERPDKAMAVVQHKSRFSFQ